MSEKYEIKILTLGYTDVGKTSILLRFTKNTFHDKYVSTIGIDFKGRTLTLGNNTIVKVVVYDTAGQERYKGLVKSFYKKADGILLTFDLCNKESFDKLDFWVKELKEYTGLQDLYIVLVGNKNDKKEERQISYEEAKEYAKKNNFEGYYEVSAKLDEGGGINNLFYDVTKGTLKKILMKNKEDDGQQNIRLSICEMKEIKEKNKACC